MKIWFLEDPARLAAEREAIETLAKSSGWLAGYAWRIDFANNHLLLDAEIQAHGATYALVMTYPATFPETPPFIKPKDPKESLSSHQYGDGTLCLEWGPDNWVSSLTGVHLLESAHKLLSQENPRGTGTRETVPSRHELTLGQTIRSEDYRLWVEPAALPFFAALPDGATGSVKANITLAGEATVALLHSVSANNGTTWSSGLLPRRLPELTSSWVQQGVFLKTSTGALAMGALSKTDDLELLLGVALPGHAVSVKDGLYGIAADFKPVFLLLIAPDNRLHMYRTRIGSDRLQRFVEVRDDNDGAVRSLDVETLANKKMAIVGLGSVGSKVALSLARAGVGHFVFVDDDILLPGNLVRHTGDWMDIGQHKVDGTRDAIARLRRDTTVEVFRSKLGTQESNTTLNRVLTAIGGCDLVVDATAVPAVFNMLSAVAATYARPLVWCEVFAGGIGGLVARSRPNLDPAPQTMRAQFHAYTAQLPPVEPQTAKDYVAVQKDGTVFVASDADVGVIAAHTARFALDTLLQPTASDFPYSMYLIGLKKGWAFNAPFETIPLDIGPHIKPPEKAVSEQTVQDNHAFLRSLLPKEHGTDPDPSHPN